jgi:hypothetical protein
MFVLMVVQSLHATVCIAEGWGFEIRLPGGNDEKKYDDKNYRKVT